MCRGGDESWRETWLVVGAELLAGTLGQSKLRKSPPHLHNPCLTPSPSASPPRVINIACIHPPSWSSSNTQVVFSMIGIFFT